MEYLKVNGTEYPAHFCGKQIDRDWDGRASKTVTLAMPYAQAVQLFVDGLRWGIVRREAGADDAAQEQDCSGYCVAGPITDNRDGTLSIKMGSYTQLEQALRELDLENPGNDELGRQKYQFFASDGVERFNAFAHSVLPEQISDTKQVQIENY